MSDFGDYPRITVWGCPGDHDCMLIDLGPGAVDLVCEDPNCSYDPFQNRPSPFAPTTADMVNHPQHYTWIPGVEPIDIIEHLPYNLGAACKYLIRCGKKNDAIEELDKAIWYVQRERARILRMRENDGRATDG